MKTSMIAPCGMNCEICIGHLREKNVCPGCFFEGPGKAYHCEACFIKNCKEKTGKYCFSCVKYPCVKLKHLDRRYSGKYGMSMLENLGFIKVYGVKKFVLKEEKKWRCKKCGALLSCHREACLSCGTGFNLKNKLTEKLKTKNSRAKLKEAKP